jgi:hypothetical protein
VHERTIVADANATEYIAAIFRLVPPISHRNSPRQDKPTTTIMSSLLYTNTACSMRPRPSDDLVVNHPNAVIFLDDPQVHDNNHNLPQPARPLPLLHPLWTNLQHVLAGETVSTARDFIDLWLFPSLVLICIHATRGAAVCLKAGVGFGDCP